MSKLAPLAGKLPRRIAAVECREARFNLIFPDKPVASVRDAIDSVALAESKLNELLRKNFPTGTPIYLRASRQHESGAIEHIPVRATLVCAFCHPLSWGHLTVEKIEKPPGSFIGGATEHDDDTVGIPWSVVIGKSLPEGESCGT